MDDGSTSRAPRKRKIGITDVAREAGVSVGAASDALSGKNRLPEETRRRVREVADRLGYRPDPAARALRTGRAPVLGLVVTSLRRSFNFDLYEPLWGRLIGAATLAAHDRGYGICVLPDLQLGSYPSIPLAGLVVVDTEPRDPELQAALAFGIPVASPAADASSGVGVIVRFDDQSVTHRALDHLWELGCRRLGVLLHGLPGVDGNVNGDFEEVELGYRSWCVQRGVEPVVVRFGASAQEASLAATQVLGSDLDGLYTVSPGAVALHRSAVKAGVTLGERLRVVSRCVGMDEHLDRLGISTMSSPPGPVMTSVVEALIDLIEGRRSAPVVVRQEFELVVRASSGAPV